MMHAISPIIWTSQTRNQNIYSSIFDAKLSYFLCGVLHTWYAFNQQKISRYLTMSLQKPVITRRVLLSPIFKTTPPQFPNKNWYAGPLKFL